MVIRAVLFDLGNTRIGYYRSSEFPPMLQRCVRCAFAAVGGSLSATEAVQVFEHAMRLNQEREDLAVRPLAGRLRELVHGHVRPGDDRIADTCRAFLEPIFACATPDVEAPYVLAELRRRGVKTGIVSNTPWGSPAAAWREELARHGLLDKVDAAVFCVDVGWRKPHPAPFHRALEQLSVRARDAVFIGDDPRWDVVGANAAGVRAILLWPGGATGDTPYTVIKRLSDVLELIQVVPDVRRSDARGVAPDVGGDEHGLVSPAVGSR